MFRQQKNVVPGENPYTNGQNTTALKRLRVAKKVTATAIAEAVGISHRKMSEIETGTSYVSPEYLERIATFLETDVESISEGLKAELVHKNIKGRKY